MAIRRHLPAHRQRRQRVGRPLGCRAARVIEPLHNIYIYTTLYTTVVQPDRVAPGCRRRRIWPLCTGHVAIVRRVSRRREA